MTDLLIIYDVEGWAYHFRAQALARYAPPDFRVRIAGTDILNGESEEHAASNPEVAHWIQNHGNRIQPSNYVRIMYAILGTKEPDIIFALCHHQAKHLRSAIKERGWTTRLIVSWNNGWPRRERDFQTLRSRADTILINNQEYWEKSGKPEKTRHISNGVDLTIFYPTRPSALRPPRVLWCGSEYHRTLKGYDDLILPLFRRLSAEGIDCDALLVNSRGNDKRTQKEMAEWYNTGTVLLCASETEGTPNTALEAAACGCTLVSTRVGNMPELIRDGENGYLVDRDLESLYQGIHRSLSNYLRLATQLQQDIQPWGWQERSKQFFELFRRVSAEPENSTATQVAMTADSTPDFSDEVTVFVSTVGAASYDECMAHLKQQDCRFRLEVIKNVAPMSEAFQLMMDRCQTPYYIQVDEDMLLRPDAVRMLYQWIQSAEPDVALVVAWLWDVHLRRGIQGVKAFRHSIVHKYPFSDVESCEKDQLGRMQKDGYRYLKPLDPEPTEHGAWTLGTHGTHFDVNSIFERYATLEHRRCQYPEKLAWFTTHANDFLQRFRNEPSEVNLMALLGILAGRLTATEHRGEKDFTTYNDLPGLKEAQAFFNALTGIHHMTQTEVSETTHPVVEPKIPAGNKNSFVRQQPRTPASDRAQRHSILTLPVSNPS